MVPIHTISTPLLPIPLSGTMNIKLIGLNGRYTHSTLSLFYLRQAFSSHLQAEISLWQYTINDNYFETLARISAGSADVICFSVYIWNSNRVAQLVMDVARISPTTRIILGGPEADAMARQYALPPVTLVLGEVEGLPQQFYTDLQQNKMAPHYEAEAHPSFSMPYQEEDFSGYLAHRHVYYESSRGCPYGCAYCLSASSKGVRHLELSQVKEELALIMASKPHTVRFIDRTFNTIPERALAIWNYLLTLGGDTCFHFEISPDRFSEEMFTFLARVPTGRFQFEIGLQSTTPAALAGVNRKTDMQQAIETIKRLSAAQNIHIHADLILGLPYETASTFANSCNDLFAAQPHYIQMGLLKILPDTPLQRKSEELELIHRHSPPYELLASPWLDHEKLAELYWLGECIEKLYNSHFFKPFFTYLARRQEKGFTFFQELMPCCVNHRLFERAATQDLMSQILADHASTRPDNALILEIMQYCWLASGRKKLPDHLPSMDLKKNRDSLFAIYPKELPGHYDRANRNHFFRKTVFAFFSAEVNQLSGHGTKGYLAFSQEQDNHSVLKRVKISAMPDIPIN